MTVSRKVKRAAVGDEVSASSGCKWGFALTCDPETEVEMPDGTRVRFPEKTLWLYDAGGCVSAYEAPPGVATIKIHNEIPNNHWVALNMDGWGYAWEMTKGKGVVVFVPPESSP